jgi:hypothetical protein
MKENSKNKVTLIFIINGVNATVEANIHEPLKTARNKALEESNNTGRPADEWQIHTEDGVLLDADKKIEELGLADEARLLLSLTIGAGGQ